MVADKLVDFDGQEYDVIDTLFDGWTEDWVHFEVWVTRESYEKARGLLGEPGCGCG